MGKRAAAKEGAKEEATRGIALGGARRLCRRCLILLVQCCVYLYCCLLCNCWSVWSWTYEPLEPHCQHRPLPANQTGLKVLVYGPEKTGTTTIARTLNQVMRTFGGIDQKIHVMSSLADGFWSRPENGGSVFPPYRLATPFAPAYKGNVLVERSEWASDYRVFNGTTREQLAEAISRCRPEAMTFDSTLDRFWLIYGMSPGAKVIFTNWRTWEAMQTSKDTFLANELLAVFLLQFLNSGAHFLPWNALVIPLWDYLADFSLSRHLADGKPFSTTSPGAGPLIMLFLHSIAERRVFQHRNSGSFSHTSPKDQASYDMFWEVGRKNIPKERIFEFNPKKHSISDLCPFLEIEGHPACANGTRIYANPLMLHEKEHPWDLAFLSPYYLLIHWLNLRIFLAVWRWLQGALASACRSLCCGTGAQSKAGRKSKAA